MDNIIEFKKVKKKIKVVEEQDESLIFTINVDNSIYQYINVDYLIYIIEYKMNFSYVSILDVTYDENDRKIYFRSNKAQTINKENYANHFINIYRRTILYHLKNDLTYNEVEIKKKYNMTFVDLANAYNLFSIEEKIYYIKEGFVFFEDVFPTDLQEVYETMDKRCSQRYPIMEIIISLRDEDKIVREDHDLVLWTKSLNQMVCCLIIDFV